MAEVEQPHLERKPRKSVAFSGDNTIMDENGEISEAPHSGAEDRTTAEKHSSPPTDQAVDEMTDMFAGLNKKKKKSSKPKAEDSTVDDDAPTPAATDDFDASALKKKKKKSTKPKTDTGDFAAKLASAGLEAPTDGADVSTQEAAPQEQEGDMTTGTGIWAHDASTPISYDLLLKRFFQLVNEHNPDILSSGSKSYKIPPPQCLREGNKKTIFANIADNAKGPFLGWSGDFVMLPTMRAKGFRGNKEKPTHAHWDSYFMCKCAGDGLIQDILLPPIEMYHQWHSALWEGRPVTNWDTDIGPQCKQMEETGVPLLDNNYKWGYGWERLEETIIKNGEIVGTVYPDYTKLGPEDCTM